MLYFYPLDFTFVCPTEICAFSDRVGEFHKLGAEVVGVSVDSKYAHLAFSQLERKKVRPPRPPARPPCPAPSSSSPSSVRSGSQRRNGADLTRRRGNRHRGALQGGLGGCQYPLLADITKAVSKDYGVLIEDGEDAGLSLRGLFLISPTGILRQMTVNDLPVGRSVDETLRLLQAFQYTDEHGEVCPANWKPGAPTMIDDPEKSMAYFTEHHAK